jgi:hypothetical protein
LAPSQKIISLLIVLLEFDNWQKLGCRWLLINDNQMELKRIQRADASARSVFEVL